jgi:transposase
MRRALDLAAEAALAGEVPVGAVVTRGEEIVAKRQHGKRARRWVVERTFAWLDWNRRLSKHYEVLPECAQAFVHIAMIRLTLNRLA